MNEEKEKIIQIIISSILFVLAIIIDKLTELSMIKMFVIYLIPYILSSYDSFKEAHEGIKEGNIFNENVLMIVASLGAMFIGLIPDTKPMFAEGIFVMLFYQVGELFEIIAKGKSEKEVKSLMSIRADYANLEIDNEIKKVSPKDIKIGNIIVVKPGEKVPLDGIVISGTSFVDTLAITGESVPRTIKEGDSIYSGYINNEGTLKIKVTKLYKDSTASRIIDLVKNATNKKSKSEKFITKFSKIYTPIVILLALVISIIPSILLGNSTTWIIRGLTFLVVSCPCALVISVPLSFFGGIGGASKKGILFKGSEYLEKISNISTIVFDKTGTLTEGIFDVTAIHPKDLNEKELLHLAAHVEKESNHPIALSVVANYTHDYDIVDGCKVDEVKELKGYGVKAKVNGETIYVGNEKLMQKEKIDFKPCKNIGSIIHIAAPQKYYGHIVISDKIKSDSKKAITYFNKNNIKTIMLSGDKIEIVKQVAEDLEIKEYYGELLPEEKERFIEDLIKNKYNNKNIAFVGDGINDSPSLALADIGISLGGIGQDIAIETADVILMQDKLSSLIDGIEISKRTLRIAKENIIFSILIKIITLILAGLGVANMWMAVFADVGVTIIAVLNSMRALK